MDELQGVLTPTNTHVLPCLKHINALLYNAVLTCRASLHEKPGDSTEAFHTKAEYIAPGQNLVHQWRFHSTTKTAGRKRKGEILQ